MHLMQWVTEINEIKRKSLTYGANMVGDSGFEPLTPAV